MKICFLGTCSGTEPYQNRKHSAFCLECEGYIYWFDAGEGCSYTGHIAGVDLLAVKNIVISHTHMDHVGGLGNLLWNIRKLRYVKKEKPYYGDIEVYIPNMETWNGIMKILRNTEGEFCTDYSVIGHRIMDGILFDDGILKVTAYHNTHLQKQDLTSWLSFSFLIEYEGKRLVYSGDVGNYHDLDEVIGGGCNCLIIETGHFCIDDVYDYCKDKQIEKIYFFHNGREILNNLPAAQKRVYDLFGEKAIICEDGMIVQTS
ncbi:MAG: ribonuclease Z [Lachnospiraceae bacterium]|nr:ribonuclease Z [Lachnospiraceae bacterium]